VAAFAGGGREYGAQVAFGLLVTLGAAWLALLIAP
jgi:hypothetical protein